MFTHPLTGREILTEVARLIAIKISNVNENLCKSQNLVVKLMVPNAAASDASRSLMVLEQTG
ncbi:MAG: hypothetical protein EBV06_01350 [Planctomycetia bacterium]|nr:hypothetical protein [Planctomycetia bacterium]